MSSQPRQIAALQYRVNGAAGREIFLFQNVLCGERYEGRYRPVCGHAGRWHQQQMRHKSDGFVSLQFRSGEACQFDWSEEQVMIGAGRSSCGAKEGGVIHVIGV